jgi:predicted permease
MREFGSVAALEEASRDTRRVRAITELTMDLRYAVRMTWRQPIFAFTAAASIALGVGANIAIFGLANELLLAAPTAAHPERVVHIRTGRGSHVSYTEWRALDESAAIAGLAGYNFGVELNWRGDTAATRITPLIVTPNFFDVMGLTARSGRVFSNGEARATPEEVVLSARFWRVRLGADPAAVGKTLMLNGRAYAVIGVLPDDIRPLPGYGIQPDVYLPFSHALTPWMDDPQTTNVQLIGRLRDGQSRDAGAAAMRVALGRAAAGSANRGATVLTVFAVIGGLSQLDEFKEVAAFFGVLAVLSCLVLAIACANVAGLLMSRSTVRQREMALRTALGASRGRLIRQMLTEGILLAAIGGAAGLLTVLALGTLLPRIPLPLPMPIELHLSLSSRLLWVAGSLSIISAILCTITPAMRASRPSLVPSLKQGEAHYAHRRFTVRGVLVVGQVAVSMVLLVTAALFLTNLTRTASLNPGFDIDHTLSAQVTFVEGRQAGASGVAIERIAERVSAVPGVASVSFARGLPLTMEGGSRTGTDIRIEGRPNPLRVDYDSLRVGPGYFETMGIELLRGRDFSRQDTAKAPSVVIVSREFVRRYFADANPIGARLGLYQAGTNSDGFTEIIGVVADSKYRTLGEDTQPAIFEPYLAHFADARMAHLVVRARQSPAALLDPVRDAISAVDPVAAIDIREMPAALTFAFLPSRIGAALMSTLGIVGLTLAMVGLYSVVAYAVSRRTSEVGVRVALGATRASVIRLVLSDTAALAGLGIAAGTLLALLVTTPLSAFLVAGLDPHDPGVFAGTAMLLAIVSLGATWMPAVRALRVNPVHALRAD